MFSVNVIKELLQNLTILKAAFDLFRAKVIQNSLTGEYGIPAGFFCQVFMGNLR